jgi:glycosyltransferase involved in cell wall biosynthesis
MKILYLHQYFVPPQAPGGTRSFEFARRLIAKGHQVLVISSDAYLPQSYRNYRRPTQTEIAGVPIVVLPVAYSNNMSFPRRILAFFQFALFASWQALRHPADVVFATSTPLTIAIPGIIAHLWHRVPLVFEVRDLWPELPIAMGALRNPIAKMAARLLEWVAYHASAHIVALSPGMAEGVMKRGIPRERVSIIPNSSDVETFDVPTSRGEQVRQQLGLTPCQPLVIYAGTFGLINGVGYIVDAAATALTIASEVRFLLVGTGLERTKITEKARTLGVLDRTLWIWDPVPKHQMPDLLAAATVATSLFIPLKPMWNNSANKFFDALAAGKPIAINYGGWQADLLRESGAGIVLPPDDPVQAAHLLADFVRDPKRLEQAASAARELAYTRFNRDHLFREFEAVLCQAAQKC